MIMIMMTMMTMMMIMMTMMIDDDESHAIPNAWHMAQGMACYMVHCMA